MNGLVSPSSGISEIIDTVNLTLIRGDIWMKGYFYCYDPKMMLHLKERHIQYITRALTIERKQKFWLYEITHEFKSAIEDVHKNII
jgi:hypothetical protein